MDVLSKASIVALIREHENQIRTLGVKRISLFGSFVRGEQDEESDVDVLVEFETDKKTFDNFMHLAYLLEDMFERRVELITPESISPYIRPYILKEAEYVPLAA